MYFTDCSENTPSATHFQVLPHLRVQEISRLFCRLSTWLVLLLRVDATMRLFYPVKKSRVDRRQLRHLPHFYLLPPLVHEVQRPLLLAEHGVPPLLASSPIVADRLTPAPTGCGPSFSFSRRGTMHKNSRTRLNQLVSPSRARYSLDTMLLSPASTPLNSSVV